MTEATDRKAMTSTSHVLRGTRWLNRDEFRAHLAALVRVENVAVLLGSGASVCAGGLTMAGLWQSFCEESDASLNWLRKKQFVLDAREAPSPNVEELADSLEIARLEWARVKSTELRNLLSAYDDVKRAVVRAAKLQDLWWTDAQASEQAEQLGSHREIIQKLCGARQPGQPSPWFFTTNYDLAIEWSAESIGLRVTNGFGGTHHRVFAPHHFDLAYRNTLARGEARFGTYNIYLAKLHGSLSWKLLDDNSVIEEPARHVWPALRAFLAGTNASEGQFLVLPSATKYTQTVGFTLGELFRRFAECLARPHTVLFTVGYSFSDEHVNRLVLTALQNPTLQLVTYLPEASKSDDQVKLPPGKAWLSKLLAQRSPQVTIVGGGPLAYLDAFSKDLPEPALFDEPASAIRAKMRDLRNFAASDEARS